MNLTKLHSLVCLKGLLFFIYALVIPGCEQKSAPPNIILIMADDLGYGELGCYGNRDINTPNLDHLADNGIKFTDFHSNGAVCTPTRAALLTGRYQQRVGLEGVIYVRGETRQLGLDPDEITLADAFKIKGYATGIMGKWHLGYQPQYNPVHFGFDEFYGYLSGNIDYHSHYDNAAIYDWYHNTDTLIQPGYVTDLITQNSIEFIRKNQHQPFFLYMAHEAPHVPLQGRKDPAYRFPGTEFTYYGPVEDRDGAYREMVEVMDEGVGDILSTLKELGLEETTLIVFLSDNGPEGNLGKNGPLSGFKTELLEGGHRVPAMLYWKDRIPAGIYDVPLMSFDLFPTLMAICGIEMPGLNLDGLDFSPLLSGADDLPERTIFWRYRNQKAARTGDWKLLITATDTTLYNLTADRAEQQNLLSSHPERFNSLLVQLQHWEAQMDQVPQKTR